MIRGSLGMVHDVWEMSGLVNRPGKLVHRPVVVRIQAEIDRGQTVMAREGGS